MASCATLSRVQEGMVVEVGKQGQQSNWIEHRVDTEVVVEKAPQSLHCEHHKLDHLQLSDPLLDWEISDWVESCQPIVAIHYDMYEGVHGTN